MSRLHFCHIDDPLDSLPAGEQPSARREWVRASLASVGRTEPLRVLIASNSLGAGGAEHQILRIMPWLQRFGLAVEHFYYGDSHDLRPRFEERGLCSHFVDRARIGRGRFFYRTVRLMRQRRYDVVHAFTGTTNLYARIPAICARVPVIFGGWRNSPMARRERLIFGLLNATTAGWIFNARSNAEAFEPMLGVDRQHLYVVPNALDIDATMDAARPALDEATRSWLDNRLLVAAVGALAARKNYDLFLDVAARVCAARSDVAFVVVGGPDSHEPQMELHLRRRVEDENLAGSVRFLGRSDNVSGFLPHVDVFLCTSPYEGCPNAVLEAMRARLPVVMTDCTDTEKLIEPGVSGYVVGLDDVAGMALRTNELLDDADKRRAFGAAARKLVERHFEASGSAWSMALIYVTEWLRRCGPRPGLGIAPACSVAGLMPSPDRVARA